MFAVKGLGSYISRGVSTVSRPLQPHGGAVDIIVVEQPDGSYKSCPWYVRFGKSQVGLKPWEKIVTVCVNDVEADFHMYLDNNGDAYFLREVEGEDGEGGTFTDEIILSPRIRRMLKSKSCDYDANRTSLGSEFEADNANLLAQTNGRRGGFLGLSFRKSGNSRDSDAAVGGATSLERAEMAADLLEVRWTTNLAKGEKWNNTRHVPKPKLPVSKVDDENVTDMKSSSINSQDVVNGPSSSPGSEQSAINKESDSEIPCSVDPENNGEINSLVGTGVGVDLSPNGSEISSKVDNGTQDMDRNGQSKISEVSASVSEESRLLESEQNVGCLLSGEECPSTGNVSGGGSLANSGSETNIVVTSMSTATEENVICHLDECNGENNGALLVSCERLKDPKDQVSVISSEPGVLPRLGTGRKEDNVDHLVHCNGDERTLVSATESECSADEQFSFSDLDDGKVDKADHVEVSSLDDGKQYSSQDVTETGEKDVAESTVTRDDGVTNHSSITFESKGVSSPINIPNHCYDAEEEFTTTVTESVPAINQFGRHQLLGRSLDSKLEAMKFGDDDHIYSDLGVHSTPRSSHISDDTNSIISDPAVEVSLCRHLLYGGMGYEAAACAFDAEKLDKDKFASLCPDIVNNDKLVVRIGGLYFPWDAALPIASAIGSQGREQILEAKGMIAVGQADITAERTPQKNMNPRNGSWKLWPFSFRRTNNLKTLSNESNSTRKDRNKGKDETMEKDENKEKAGSLEKDENKEKDGSTKKGGNTVLGERKVVKRTIRAKTPTSEQLASLKLNSGKNYVTFTLSTEALGKQQVDARIFLWKWDARIVISDVDGTITKSDVLGHVMPLMGYDWSHFGVTHLFSAIKENGYKLLFLSARSILQASITRQFLINLKQDGKTLPEGPIVISPDGIFPSLYREVIRRAPHEFKISCLEDIKALFPRDHNPFYAGFGNRDTDELSYLKVGIPRGKIFTINPKGEVAVNRRVDTKSYTSLHSLVHDIFPETPVIEPEDYNQWNFWRLPPPDVKI